MSRLLPYLLGFFFLVAIVESRGARPWHGYHLNFLPSSYFLLPHTVTLSGHYWFAVQHEGVWVPNEQCMIGRGLGYRGR